jgi:hypothetical protein
MEQGTHWRWAAVLLVAATAALVLALPAQAHDPVHWKTLTPGTSSSVRSTSYDHGTFKIEMIAYFGRVRRTSAYLNKVTFKTCPDSGSVVQGWLMFAYNNSVTYRYNADSSRYYYSCGSFTQQVDRTFTGGYSNGNVAITVEKRNIDPYCSMVACDAHKSYAVFYVP